MLPGIWVTQLSRQSTHEGGKIVSSTHRSPFPQGNIPDTHFCQRHDRHQGHSSAGRIKSMKNSNDTIRNRTRDRPACSAVPQACYSSTFKPIGLKWRNKSGEEGWGSRITGQKWEVTATLGVAWRLARSQVHDWNATFNNNKKPIQALTPCSSCWLKSHARQTSATSLTSKEHAFNVSVSWGWDANSYIEGGWKTAMMH